MTDIRCLRHFETAIDPETPASEWTLSAVGDRAMNEFLEREFIHSLECIYSSPEPKALQTAEAAAKIADIPLRVDERIQEVDRSGEGFIDENETYVDMVEQYFRTPEVPFDWENRREVESRIRRFVSELDTDHDSILLVSHGMLLTTLITPLLDNEPFEFWSELDFGAVIPVESTELERHWR